MNWVFLLSFLFGSIVAEASDGVLTLKFGFVQKVPCKGRLYTSAVGNENLVRLEALPKELGCAVILKPISSTGQTNLILETSVGTVEKLLSISK